MKSDLKPQITVPFDALWLDPNNPRLGLTDLPGYGAVDKLFDAAAQSLIERMITERYPLAELRAALLGQGWLPVDPILIWEHPKKRGMFLVVEGNTRVTVLRQLRRDLVVENDKLAKFTKRKDIDPEQVEEQRAVVEQIERVVAATAELQVTPVNAATVKELEGVLPRLLGVRHVTHAHGWGTQATNLYVYLLYRQHYSLAHPKKPLAFDDVITKRVADLVSLGPTVTRRRIQAAAAFIHFKNNYASKLPDGEKFKDEDQYFFENILANAYAAEQFGFKKGDFHLSREMEEVLFRWAFAKPRTRHSVEKNPNVLRKAEDIRLWAQISRYDATNHTHLAGLLNVSEPEKATPIREVEIAYLNHQAMTSPVDVLKQLIKTLKEMPVDVLQSQGSHLRPMIGEVRKKCDEYVKILDALAKP